MFHNHQEYKCNIIQKQHNNMKHHNMIILFMRNKSNKREKERILFEFTLLDVIL